MDAGRYFIREGFCILIAFGWRLCNFVKLFKLYFCERLKIEEKFLKIVYHYEILKIKLRWMLKDILRKLKIFAF